MKKNKNSADFEIAYNLQSRINRFGITENACLEEKEKDKEYKPRTLIDQTLELIDPNPNVHTLFVQFNERFFSNVLLSVEVKWSQRMTSCAGTCTFHPRNRQCVIALSAPLLKLRPRKDLVETLLHEMIHGYLFLTNNNRDRDGHGPEFCKHMNRINQAAGTKITIYHSFHEEVRLHQQHWWKCDGPCHKQPPYFGMVRRATNRAPGPNDFWWQRHQQNCGGKYIKIKEPENYKSKNAKGQSKTASVSKPSVANKGMLNWLSKPTSSVPIGSKASPVSTISKPAIVSGVFKKLGNTTNNVHGWGTGGPTGSGNSGTSQKSNNITSSSPKFAVSATLGGNKSAMSNLLTKFSNITENKNTKPKALKAPEKTIDSRITQRKVTSPIPQNKETNNPSLKMVECPVCDNFVCSSSINEHVDQCLLKDDNKVFKSPVEKKIPGTGLSQKRKNVEDTPTRKQPKLDFSPQSNAQVCPICNKQCSGDINAHIDKCLDNNSLESSTPIKSNGSKRNTSVSDSIISLSDSSSTESSPEFKIIGSPSSRNDLPSSSTAQKGHKCLVCDKFISPNISLNDHLEECMASVFNDDSAFSSASDCAVDEINESVSQENDRFPCPVCMALVSQPLMDKHLDTCLLCD